VQNVNRCKLRNERLIVGMQDVSLPAGAKIFSVRARMKVERVTGVQQQPHCLVWFLQVVIYALITGPKYGREGALELVFLPDPDGSHTNWDKFTALRDAGRTLVLQFPTGEQFYNALSGELKWEWLLRRDTVRYRKATITYVQVAKQPQAHLRVEKIRTGETEPYETVLIDAAGNETVINHEENK
jgi:hypothetical protein